MLSPTRTIRTFEVPGGLIGREPLETTKTFSRRRVENLSDGGGTGSSNPFPSSSESDELPSEQARPLGTWVCQPSQPSAAGDLSHDDRRAMRSATTAMRSTHHGPLHGQRVANLVFEIVGRRLGALVLRQKMSGRRREAAIAPNRHGALFVEELESVQWP